MGPSRECDGDGVDFNENSPETQGASMGPSRECDGDLKRRDLVEDALHGLQWGRRVNATETHP